MQGGGAAVQVLGDVARAVGRSEARRAGGWLRLWPRRRGVSWRNQARRAIPSRGGRETDGSVGLDVIGRAVDSCPVAMGTWLGRAVESYCS